MIPQYLTAARLSVTKVSGYCFPCFFNSHLLLGEASSRCWRSALLSTRWHGRASEAPCGSTSGGRHRGVRSDDRVPSEHLPGSCAPRSGSRSNAAGRAKAGTRHG